MKCAYEAANGVEAHMIANLLEQHAIDSRIDGEYLAGGIGELPAAGLVRVMVSETNYERAREIIREWEAKAPPSQPERAPRRPNAAVWFVLGVVVSASLMSWLNRARAPIDGVDFNGDGRLDEKYTLRNGQLSKVEGDANLDGRVDYVYSYDDKGLPLVLEADLDFDGRFDVKQTFERNNTKRVEIDWDQDGRVDKREDYSNGVLREVTYFAPDGVRVVKRDHYQSGVLTDADLDSDDDGVFDTHYKYDRYGEIAESTRR